MQTVTFAARFLQLLRLSMVFDVVSGFVERNFELDGDFCARFAEKQCKITMSQRVDLMARSRVQISLLGRNIYRSNP